MSDPNWPVFEIGKPIPGSDAPTSSGVTFANAEPTPLPRDPTAEGLAKGRAVDAWLSAFHPQLHAALHKVERAKEVVRQWEQNCSALSAAVLDAQNRYYGGSPELAPERRLRLKELAEQLRECREELCAAVEERDAAQSAYEEIVKP